MFVTYLRINSSKNGALGTRAFWFVMSLFSYFIIELEETELVWIVRVNQFSKLFEVSVVHAQKVIFDTQLINQICLSPMAFEKFGHLVV